jgi:hypothetical protein
MKIAILEHFTSMPGPARGSGIGLRIEGGAMRDAVVSDLLEIPGVALTVLHRPDCPVRPAPPRRRGRGPVAPGGRLRGVPVEGPREAAFRAEVRRSEAALVIAPETDGVLEALAAIVEDEGRLLIGPSTRAIRLAADKLETARCLAAADLPSPRTASIDFGSARGRLREWTPPYVLKPRDGCGGSGVVLVRRTGEIERALGAVRRATARADFLAQEFVEGDDASVSLLAGGPRSIRALGVNRQRIDHGVPFRYLGGETPSADPAAARAADLARRAAAALAAATRGVRGYLGVDVVIGAAGPRVIEINPRLTTAYIGLRRVVERNLAALMVDAALGRALPDRVRARGACRFDADGRVAHIAAGRGPAGERSGGWRSTSAGTSAAST